MPKRYIGSNTFDASLDRMIEVYEQGHRVVVSFSAGKDSGVCLELCIIAAGLTNRLPVEVVMRDEEIMLPGTFEYAERVAARPEIDFHWLIANQPVVNIFNRKMPYFWVFDPALPQEEWVRQPPEFAQFIPENSIEYIAYPKRFPPPEGKDLFTVIGLRVSESINRRMGIFSSRGHLTNKDAHGTRKIRPIYDWTDADIWKAMKDNKWDYNEAYNVLVRFGVPRHLLRIAPPTMTASGAEALSIACRAWPKWFDKVCTRLPGVRTAAMYGKRVLEPIRRIGETWEACYKRTCIDEAPEWIAARATKIMNGVIARHRKHSNDPLPQNTLCIKCKLYGSWQRLCKYMYMGDPFSLKQGMLPAIEPEFFREGAGYWQGKPAFS